MGIVYKLTCFLNLRHPSNAIKTLIIVKLHTTGLKPVLYSPVGWDRTSAGLYLYVIEV